MAGEIATVVGEAGSALSKMVRRLRPLADRVLVRKLEQPTRQVGSIILPETAMEKLSQGIVVSVGPGLRSPTTGERFPVGLKPGDKVLLPDFGGMTFKVDNDKYSLFNESDILCVLHDE